MYLSPNEKENFTNMWLTVYTFTQMVLNEIDKYLATIKNCYCQKMYKDLHIHMNSYHKNNQIWNTLMFHIFYTDQFSNAVLCCYVCIYIQENKFSC